MRTVFPLLAFAFLFLPSPACLLAEQPAGDDSPEVTTPEDDDTGRYSHLLSLKLAYQTPTDGKEAEFVAMLTNVSKRALRLLVDTQSFDSVLVVTTPTGEQYELMTEKFRFHRYFGSRILFPFSELGAGKSIAWRIPLSSLHTGPSIDVQELEDSLTIAIPEDSDLSKFDIPPTPESLAGCKVSSTLSVAVVPEKENTPFSGGNALQTSNVVKIPATTNR